MTRALKRSAATAFAGMPEQAAIEALVAGRHGDPFAILGPHRIDEGTSIRVFAPAAEEIQVIDRKARVLGNLNKVHEAGFFIGIVDVPVEAAYRLRFRRDDAEWEEGDPYRFPAVG
jgi:1,4-alpha-glucan branching enzyme